VGAGPFPTEDTGPDGDWLRLHGNEYGATTGRSRRCGWFDAVAVAWAARLAGFTELALTKLDVLDGRQAVPVCVAYRDGEARWEWMPPEESFGRARPEYVALPGWPGSVAEARQMTDLPEAARAYLREIERWVGVPISLIGVGPEREATLRRPAYS
jgi:adenylosuccinate synthase